MLCILSFAIPISRRKADKERAKVERRKAEQEIHIAKVLRHDEALKERIRLRRQKLNGQHCDKERRSPTSADRISRYNLDPDVEVDEELIELARLRDRALSYLNSPCGRHPDPDGFVTLSSHRLEAIDPRLNHDECPQWPFHPVVAYKLVKIDSLPEIDQNCVYEENLYRATRSQVRDQYELHCRRLRAIRSRSQKKQHAYKEQQKQGNINHDARICSGTSMGDYHFQTTGDKAVKAYQEAYSSFEDRLRDKRAEGGVIRLLERCESMLKKADKSFVPIPWRQPVPQVKKRWADGQKGWTGLKSEDAG